MTSSQQGPAIGPQIGAPPSLEQIPVARLTVDPTYQRAIDSTASRRIIAGMVKRWDWSLCQPLVVSRRDDGALLILDGQHRHAGAQARGDIPFLPCTILSSLDVQGEARTFVELNTKRQKLSQSEVFHGMLAAGNADAKAVLDLIEQSRWSVVRHSNTACYKPGDLACAPALVEIYRSKGGPTVSFALNTLRAAYPDVTVRQSATLLHALVMLFDMLPDDPVPMPDLIAAIGAVPPDLWLSRGIIHRQTFPALSRHTAIAATMLMAARGEEPPSTIPVARQPSPVAAPASDAGTKAPGMAAKPTLAEPRPSAFRPRAKPSDFTFGTSGKGWCSQCEQLVSREKASACADRFCKARPHT